MAEEALKFKSSLNDSDFSAGLKRMEKAAEQSAKRFESSQAAAARKSSEAIGGFVEASKDSFKALGEIAIGAGIGLQLDNALVRVAELVGKIREANAEAGRAGKVAGGERGAGAGVGFESRIKAVQDFNSEMSKSKAITDGIGSSLASSSQEYFKQKDALIKSQEATGQITADESKRAQIANDRDAALQDVASKQSAVNRDRQETADRLQNLEKELTAAKNAQYSADTAIRDAGEQQAQTLTQMIADERARLALYESQSNALDEQKKTAQAIAQARADSQVKEERDNFGKGIQKAQEEHKKKLEENKKIGEDINDELKKAAEGNAKKFADEMERAKNASEAAKTAVKDAFDARVNSILSGPDARRDAKRNSEDHQRAEHRAGRDIERDKRNLQDAIKRGDSGAENRYRSRLGPEAELGKAMIAEQSITALATAVKDAVALLLVK